MRAGEVDDDTVCGRLERRGALVREAPEDDVGTARGGLVVRDERGQRPVAGKARVERDRGLTGRRVGAERDRLELGMVEHPVERLLAGVAGAAEDGGREHVRIMHDDEIYAEPIVRQREQRLVLEDGTVFPGISVGADGFAAGEACFTTAMTGYEEAVTDPSYVAQVLCFSYPLIGTYGVDEARMESERVQCEGVVMRDARPELAAWLRERGVVALTAVDTRTLVRKIRDGGVLRCALGDAPADELQRARARRAVHRRQPAAAAAGRDRAVLGGRGAACRRRRPRREAVDPAPPGRGRRRGVRRARLVGRGRDPRGAARARC